MYRYLVCAGDFYGENQVGINDKKLEKEIHVLANQMEKVNKTISEKAKRGMFAAISVPISLTGPPPKRSDRLARHKKEPKSSKNIIPIQKLHEPQFSLLLSCQMDTVCVPDVFEEELLPGISDSTSTAGGVASGSSSGLVTVEEVT